MAGILTSCRGKSIINWNPLQCTKKLNTTITPANCPLMLQNERILEVALIRMNRSQALDNHVAETKSQGPVEESDVAVSYGSSSLSSVVEEIQVIQEATAIWRSNSQLKFEVKRQSSPSSSGYAAREATAVPAVSLQNLEKMRFKKISDESQIPNLHRKRHVDEVWGWT